MIEYFDLARDVSGLISAAKPAGSKPVLLLGDQVQCAMMMLALSEPLGIEPVNLNLELSQSLISTSGARANPASLIASLGSARSPLLLDRIQILMLPSLMVNALDVLTRVARTRAVCASWPGRLDGCRLRYADPNHPEYLDEDASRALVVEIPTKEGLRR